VKENLKRLTEHYTTQGAISIVDRGQGQFTPSGGVNFGITNNDTAGLNVRGYANYAKSFFVQSQTNNAPQYGVAPDQVNEGGHGFDWGVKADVFNGRLKFTLGGFYVVRENVRVTDEDGVIRRIGIILSRGLEFDATARVVATAATTDFRFGYGYTNARYTNAGNDLDRMGRRMAGVPEHNAYLVATHRRTRGFLRGARASLGITYTGSTYPLTDQGGINTTIYGDIYVLSHSGYRGIKIPDYFSTRGTLAYEWRVGKWRHEVSLTAANLIDDEYVTRARRLAENFNLSFAYVIKL
jgi:outer membrane receptor for ferric coprogen and ferric-rhodotorulic acid